MAAEELQHALNRVAGTLARNLDAQGAANVWAGTVARNLDLLGALDVKARAAGYTGPPLQLNGVLNRLAGTTNFDTNGAAGALT